MLIQMFIFTDADTSIIYSISNPQSWEVLGVNLLGIVAIAAWSFVLSVVIFLPLKKFGMYRIDRETEFRGNDLAKHGESAYPRDAWVELQVRKEQNVPVVVLPLFIPVLIVHTYTQFFIAV